MKIDLTREEYRDLLDMLYIAEWVLTAHKIEEDPRVKRYSELEQKFLALAKKMGYENLVEYVPVSKQYYPTRDFEETSSAHPFIDEYNDINFWDELAIRLSVRDLAKKVGGYDKLADLSREERFLVLDELEEFYGEEFSSSGLDNLQLRKNPGPRRLGKFVH